MGAVINNNPSVNDYQQWLKERYDLDVGIQDNGELPVDEDERKVLYNILFPDQ